MTGAAGLAVRAVTAFEHGLTTLETGNDEANEPMRAINARLRYQPRPDKVTMRGPLFGGMMTR